jgi:hypothetical protein
VEAGGKIIGTRRMVRDAEFPRKSNTINLSTAGQKSFCRSSRKRMNPLGAQNFRF